jgi:acyl dehydratase
MAIQYPEILAKHRAYPPRSFSVRDTALYALSLGMGADPLDPTQLRFVYEPELRALPTMACVIGHESIRDLDLGIDYARLVHGGQALTLFRPLPVSGVCSSQVAVESVFDQGSGKGAIVNLRRTVCEDGGGLLAEMTLTLFCRGDGGFGGPPPPAVGPHQLPERPPDRVLEQPTQPQAALLYRLNGDLNPLHADPETARRAGFDRPVLHGLATFGMAGCALVREVCAHDPARVRSMSVRFAAPVYPGETLRTEIWQEGSAVSFRTIALERDVVALKHGRAELLPGEQ